jgi:hypothetical protein
MKFRVFNAVRTLLPPLDPSVEERSTKRIAQKQAELSTPCRRWKRSSKRADGRIIKDGIIAITLECQPVRVSTIPSRILIWIYPTFEAWFFACILRVTKGV